MSVTVQDGMKCTWLVNFDVVGQKHKYCIAIDQKLSPVAGGF